ncbi:hypothetical protein FACUT_728 [Fusarium acutatum]|uniref:Uncharacterized protein n=1 Tax=Fusarium acutatum TaxID=78861 RepID=A0A8H4NT61_9HYPO|nr:hypothetical protein FACUT_728 [Fusarium acutatum]
MACVRNASANPQGGKRGSDLLRAAGKGRSALTIKTKRALRSAVISHVKQPKPKLVCERTRSQVRDDLRKADRKERKEKDLPPRTHKDPLEFAEEDLPPIVVFTEHHYDLLCLDCVRSYIAGKGELKHCKIDPERHAKRYALYESGGHTYDLIPNVTEPLVHILKKALLDDKESAISNACIALRFTLNSLFSDETKHFFAERNQATKPLHTIGEAQE